MLNYKPPGRLGLTIVGESSAEVYRILVDEGRKMTFNGQPDLTNAQLPELLPFPVTAAAEAEPASRGAAEGTFDQADRRLNTDELKSVLPSKLRTIHREARLANDELGINTLFLTLGVLEWQDSGAKLLKAPLLFVPVVLESQSNGGIKLAHDGGDVGDNLPLRAKLTEFGLKCPEYDDEQPISGYFEALAKVVADHPGWTVDPDQICVAFFNYEKYAMYKDLSGDAWPDGRKLWNHTDICSLLGGGYSDPYDDIGDKDFLDDIRPADASFEIYDADSSQTIAMMRTAQGHSLVIEGPPGTGKSQTITNIIAESAAMGKTVLFVAAKRAAVDVVKRNLENAGLGAICLDLHDKLTNRREFYSEIRSTLNKSLTLRGEEQRVARLIELQTKLTAYSRAANEPMVQFGLSPFIAMSHIARLPVETTDDRDGRIPFERISHLRHERLRATLPAVRALQERAGLIGVPMRSPFWGAAISYIDPALRLDLESDTVSAIECLAKAAASLRMASDALRVDVPSTADDVHLLRRCIERAIAAPVLDGVAVKQSTWKTAEPTIRETALRLVERNEVIAKYDGRVDQAIWTAGLANELRVYEDKAGRWYSFVFSDFRAAKRQVGKYLSPGQITAATDQLALLRHVKVVQDTAAFISERESEMQALFGVHWHGAESDPDVIETVLSWVLRLIDDVDSGALPVGFKDFFSGEHDNQKVLGLVQKAETDSEAAVEAYGNIASLLRYSANTSRSEPWETLADRLRTWKSALPQLSHYIAYNEARGAVVNQGLAVVAQLADRWELGGSRLEECLLRSYYTGVLRESMDERAPLRSFERVEHEQAITEFRSLDDFKLVYNRALVRREHQARLPRLDSAVGNLQVLKVQCELQRSHKPIRWTMARAGEAIQRAKPVFMMSPLSVAIHLPPELPPFDVVIFDEASQIKPEDALCSIIRGKQIVVVGDTRQMPPTNFFDRVVDDDAVPDEDSSEDVERANEVRKLESILSLMASAVAGRARRPDLRWHYRSLHQSLIQPSNELFYDNRLVIFPSAQAIADGVGIVFHHHPETVYEAGRDKRINKREAEIVAAAVHRHVQNHRDKPKESLMVAAINKPQSDLIFDELAKLERQDPDSFQRFRELHPFEPLVVKNLENIQGDERDVVFISITYGRDASGVVHQRFGPLLADGGERRLNVLISRSRRRCEVFSNITADEIRSDITASGVVALKRYLSYAEIGKLDVWLPTGEAEESPFEEEVCEALRSRGYTVHTQVGCEGYRIDLAIVDPDCSGRYVIGVECDGATYHSAQSARDRDKLRQQVLEHRGWRLHRIWSPDWWQDKSGEVVRLIEAVESARAMEARSPSRPVQAVEDLAIVEEGLRASARSSTRPYVVADLPPIESEEDLERYMRLVVQKEGPIVHDLLVDRLRVAARYGRAGRNVRAWLEGLISDAVSDGSVKLTDGAYYSEASQLESPRDWSRRPNSERKSEFLPVPELSAAIVQAVAASFGIDEEPALRHALHLMGIRATENALAKCSDVLGSIVASGDIVVQDGQLRLAASTSPSTGGEPSWQT